MYMSAKPRNGFQHCCHHDFRHCLHVHYHFKQNNAFLSGTGFGLVKKSLLFALVAHSPPGSSCLFPKPHV